MIANSRRVSHEAQDIPQCGAADIRVHSPPFSEEKTEDSTAGMVLVKLDGEMQILIYCEQIVTLPQPIVNKH